MKNRILCLIVAAFVVTSAFSGHGLPSAQAASGVETLQPGVLHPAPDDPQEPLAWAKEECFTFMKVKFCAKVEWKNLKLRVGVSVAGRTKWWTVADVGCYEYGAGVASAKVCVRDYKWKKPKLTFTLTLSGCVNLVLSKKCKTFLTRTYTVP